jgi:L-threonine kinase
MLQGTLAMVTCPIDLFATATVEVSAGTGVVQGPSDSPKANQAIRLVLKRIGRSDVDIRLRLRSPIPRRKGMASSTADVVAAIGATAAALNREIPTRQIAEMALSIEPSDGVMLPGVALFAHRSGRIARSLGHPPGMGVLALEFAESVDTEVFNRVDRRAVLQSQAERFEEALGLIVAGLGSSDGILIGQGATLNALAYQMVVPNPRLSMVLDLARRVGAVGVNVAHSGTVLGLLFLDDPEQVMAAARHAESAFPDLIASHQHRLIGGGVTYPGTDVFSITERTSSTARPQARPAAIATPAIRRL